MTLIYPPVPGIAHMRAQSQRGPPLPLGDCLGSLAHYVLGHPSGAQTAKLGWLTSKHKHPYTHGSVHDFIESIPRGFPVWFDGGTPTLNHPDGDGHVILSAIPFYGWSEDRLRAHFYDRVLTTSILTWNPTHPHHLLGWTEDIAGFPIPYKPGSKDPYRKASHS